MKESPPQRTKRARRKNSGSYAEYSVNASRLPDNIEGVSATANEESEEVAGRNRGQESGGVFVNEPEGHCKDGDGDYVVDCFGSPFDCVTGCKNCSGYITY